METEMELLLQNEAVNGIKLVSVLSDEVVGKTNVGLISLILVYTLSVKKKRLYI